MTDRDRINRWNEKEDFIEEVKAVLGVEPPAIRQLLVALSHPALLEHTIKYFRSLDSTHDCKIYSPPWSCALEAEAKYENLKFGWLGSPVGFDDHWCEPCRVRLLGESARNHVQPGW